MDDYIKLKIEEFLQDMEESGLRLGMQVFDEEDQVSIFSTLSSVSEIYMAGSLMLDLHDILEDTPEETAQEYLKNTIDFKGGELGN